MGSEAAVDGCNDSTRGLVTTVANQRHNLATGIANFMKPFRRFI